MHRTCVNNVDNLLMGRWTSLGQLSPEVARLVSIAPYWVEQVSVSHKIIPHFTRYLYPYTFTPLPLTEHYLYPVSTAPIIRTTKEN
jgi:hypothetical protein